MKLIDNHPMLGEKVSWVKAGSTKVEGKVTGVRLGQHITDIRKCEIVGRGIRFRIKPDDGSRAVWTDSVIARSNHGQ